MEVDRTVAKRILIGIDEERLRRAMKAIEELPTRSRTARDIAELIDEPVYVAYEALRHLGYRVDRDYVASQVGTAEERVPLFERIAQIDTGDMTVMEIAERFGVSELRVQNALALLRRFAKVGGYKTFPRRTRKRLAAMAASRDADASAEGRGGNGDAGEARPAENGRAVDGATPAPAAAKRAEEAGAAERDAAERSGAVSPERPRPRPDDRSGEAGAPSAAAARRKLRMRLSVVRRLKGTVKRG